MGRIERALSWPSRFLYAVIFVGLLALIFGVDTAPHFGPTWIDDPALQELSR